MRKSWTYKRRMPGPPPADKAQSYRLPIRKTATCISHCKDIFHNSPDIPWNHRHSLQDGGDESHNNGNQYDTSPGSETQSVGLLQGIYDIDIFRPDRLGSNGKWHRHHHNEQNEQERNRHERNDGGYKTNNKPYKQHQKHTDNHYQKYPSDITEQQGLQHP